MPAALVPEKLARVFTGRLSVSAAVNEALIVGVSVWMALTFSPVTSICCCTAPTSSLASSRSSWRTASVTPTACHFLKPVVWMSTWYFPALTSRNW